MPLWVIYHPPTTFTTKESKRALAQSITDIYLPAPLPAFYVNVVFSCIDPDSYYIGAVSRPSPHVQENEPCPQSDKPFIRIVIEHIARSLPNEEIRDGFLNLADAALKPHIADKGYDWEYSVAETRRDLWKVNGLAPPLQGTEAEEEWVRLNRPVPYEPAKGGLVNGVVPWEGGAKRAKL